MLKNLPWREGHKIPNRNSHFKLLILKWKFLIRKMSYMKIYFLPPKCSILSTSSSQSSFYSNRYVSIFSECDNSYFTVPEIKKKRKINRDEIKKRKKKKIWHNAKIIFRRRYYENVLTKRDQEWSSRKMTCWFSSSHKLCVQTEIFFFFIFSSFSTRLLALTRRKRRKIHITMASEEEKKIKERKEKVVDGERGQRIFKRVRSLITDDL